MIPKFRAWDKKEKQLLKIGLIDLEDKTVYNAKNERFDKSYSDRSMQKRNHEWGLFNDLIFMQSTGLYDKNGKEIFEGDILHWKDCEPVDDEMVYEDIIVVYWSDEFMMWKAKNEDTDYIDLYDYSDNRELEVLGNIFENPKMLDEVEE